MRELAHDRLHASVTAQRAMGQIDERGPRIEYFGEARPRSHARDDARGLRKVCRERAQSNRDPVTRR
jgi:hypothetical protein